MNKIQFVVKNSLQTEIRVVEWNQVEEGGDELAEILDVESIRKQLKMTQEQMADYLEITRRGYLNKVQGFSSFTAPELIKVAKLWNKRIAVMDGEDTYSFKINKM